VSPLPVAAVSTLRALALVASVRVAASPKMVVAARQRAAVVPELMHRLVPEGMAAAA
jgi:hypothetical protein